MTNFTVTPNHGMTPLAVVFAATAQVGATGYHWDFGDGSTDQGQSVIHTYNGGGTYNVTLTVIISGVPIVYTKNGAVIVSRFGNFDSDFDGYAVGGSGNQGFPTGPAPLQVIFSGLDSNCGFTWDYGDGQIENLGRPGNPKCSHVYDKPGRYTVKLSADVYAGDQIITRNAFTRNNYITVT